MQKNRLGNFPTRFIIEPKNIDFMRFLFQNQSKLTNARLLSQLLLN
jgi:hypothetical protein